VIIWDSQDKEYTGLVNIRNILDILVFLCDSLKMASQQDYALTSQMNEKDFIAFFLDKYLNLSSPYFKKE